MVTGKIVINFTPTGMLPMKKDTPYVPITTEEIIADVKEASELGITMVHLHVRDENTGMPCYKKGNYAKVISGIREFSKDLVICVSTSGRLYSEFSKRSDVLTLEGDLKPDMASLTLSSLNFNRQASINEPDMITGLLNEMNQRGIKPELEAFDSGMLNYAKYLIKKGLLKPPYYTNLILGNIACAQPNLLHLGMMMNDVPAGALCSVGGIGDSQLKMNSVAISMGMGVRVGLEDNFWYDRHRTKLARNIDLIERIHRIIKANDKTVMPSSELREKLKLGR